MEEQRYECKLCDYRCVYTAHWVQHTETEKHKNNGVRLPRRDKVFDPKCKNCDYTTMRTTNMKLHYLNKHGTLEERKKGFKYYCNRCDIGTFSKSLFKLHKEAKHLS
jgi:hypothetical protein